MAERAVDYLEDKTNIWYGVHGRKEGGGEADQSHRWRHQPAVVAHTKDKERRSSRQGSRRGWVVGLTVLEQRV